MKVVDPLYLRAIYSPDQIFLTTPDRSWSYGGVEAEVNQIIGFCVNQGIKIGDKVGILATNQPAYIFWILALTRIGAVCVCLNVRLTLTEITRQLQTIGVRFLVTDATIGLENITILSLSPHQVQKITDPAPILDLERPQSIFFSSGTTGTPKAIGLSLQNHFYSAAGVLTGLSVCHSDKSWLLCLPLFHVGAFAIVWRCLWSGVSIYLTDRFDASGIIEVVDNNEINWVSFVPTMLIRVLDHPAFLGGLSSWQKLKGIMIGGAPINDQLQQRCLELKLPIVCTYGLTEASSTVTILTNQAWQHKPSSCGRTIPGLELKIEDRQIMIKGRSVWEEGWFNTKDIGYLDEDGYLFVIDRLDSMIICGGENIYPREVESVLLHHPHILDACVVGRPDQEWGQIPVAVIEAKQTIGVEEIKKWCSSLNLASYKIPKQIITLKQIPKTASGKNDRASLVLHLAERLP